MFIILGLVFLAGIYFLAGNYKENDLKQKQNQLQNVTPLQQQIDSEIQKTK